MLSRKYLRGFSAPDFTHMPFHASYCTIGMRPSIGMINVPLIGSSEADVSGLTKENGPHCGDAGFSVSNYFFY